MLMIKQNEDCGQMSAWYIFGALGFYPVNPVSKEFVIGSYVLRFFLCHCLIKQTIF